MAGFQTVISQVLTDINRGSEYSARVRLAIVEAIQFYGTKRLGWNQKRATAALASGVEYLALPTDWIENDSLRLSVSPTEVRKLEEVTFDYMDEESLDPSHRGRPAYYAVQNRSLRFYPIPDASYNLQMSYHYRLGEISLSASDSASNAWTNEGLVLIRSRATADVLETYIGGQESWAQADRLRARELETFEQLKAQANREQSGGGLRPYL